jgi:hypothetical protein
MALSRSGLRPDSDVTSDPTDDQVEDLTYCKLIGGTMIGAAMAFFLSD